MSVATFIPEIWSARLMSHLDKNHVFANLVNRDYEGEISEYGDTVHIGSIGNITIKKYNKTDIEDPEELSMSDQTLVIDQGDYFNFGIDDVDAAQVRAPLMDKAMARAAYGLSDAVDKFLADKMATSAGIQIGTTGTPIDFSTGATKAYDTLVQVKVAMDKANVPKAGRWIVVPPEFEGLMLLDPRFATSFGPEANNRLVNGLVARGAGFDIYVSNNVKFGAGKYEMIASTNETTTYAEQIIKTEAYRPEKRFKDAIKGLHVYGAKVTQGAGIAKVWAKFGAE